jgi:hypothetical protein
LSIETDGRSVSTVATAMSFARPAGLTATQTRLLGKQGVAALSRSRPKGSRADVQLRW